jgi:CBS domain-containing protein
MKVSRLMTRDVEVLDPDDTLKDAAEKMGAADCGCLPVVDGDNLVGILTDRDITIRGVAEGREPAATRVREVMTRDVLFCFEDQDVVEAAKIMAENQIRRLVVVDREGRLAGIVALGDFALIEEARPAASRLLEKISEPGFGHEARG